VRKISRDVEVQIFILFLYYLDRIMANYKVRFSTTTASRRDVAASSPLICQSVTDKNKGNYKGKGNSLTSSFTTYARHSSRFLPLIPMLRSLPRSLPPVDPVKVYFF